MTSGLCSGPTLACILALAAPGWAQSRAALDPCDAYPECTARAEQARKLAADEAYDAAFTTYQAAYALRPSPKLLYNMARVLHKAGHLSRAADYYDHYIASGKTEPPEQLAKAAAYQKAVEQELEQAKAASSSVLGAASVPPTPATAQPAPKGEYWRGRPVWRVVAGAAAGTVGLALLGVGISGLASHGTCRTWTEAAWYTPVCVEQYTTLEPGAALLGTGLGVAVAGTLLATIPQRKRREASLQLVPTAPLPSAARAARD